MYVNSSHHIRSDNARQWDDVPGSNVTAMPSFINMERESLSE